MQKEYKLKKLLELNGSGVHFLSQNLGGKSQPGLQSRCQDSQGYTVKPYVEHTHIHTHKLLGRPLFL